MHSFNPEEPAAVKRAREAAEATIRDFYRAIGTPPPAPGIETLGLIAAERAWEGVRQAWEEGVRDEQIREAVAEALRELAREWPDADEGKMAEVAIDALLAASPGGKA